MSKIIDAVSIVITCADQIFAIQRQNFLKAFPGYWAFPGGKVETGDEDFAPAHDLTRAFDPKFLGTVVREGQEELGIDLREELEKGHVKSVDYLGLAVTPDFNPYRFATHFFKIDFTHKLEFVVDRNEAQVSEWMRCDELLHEFKAGKILAVPPVIKVIETLGRGPGTKEIKDLNFEYDHTEMVPYIESLHGIIQIMPLSHTLPPATRTNAFLIGGILVDPSPRDEEEYRKFKNTLKPFDVRKILITHHHPDHFERSDKLARELGLPMFLSRGTHRRILKSSPDFFQDVDVHFVQEGDVLSQWLGEDLLVMEIPGHDDDQVAIYPRNLYWFLAGDLFQGIGTVVIGGDEGDMQKYFATLERIIKLSPKVLYPSHGIGLGGTNILEKTLEHRKMREAQIFDLHQQGLKPEGMLPRIYAEVKQELWPYALENIHKHLEKLKRDGRI